MMAAVETMEVARAAAFLSQHRLGADAEAVPEPAKVVKTEEGMEGNARRGRTHQRNMAVHWRRHRQGP